ncbi:ArnT family glycosyltransferase [Francisella frigiditurris]|uniref:Dolichyl-phosphate-mannose-mannosyltransferase family protein n=1 Tax=Francisella frigiditurris TaxID=1542390 RepID=A0A1J0KUK4_9GAMM|nr:glycosyltransferase family 39 protein [Francisella frigiditurris]APC97326.1 dolichyl-phosphate-mannose-mannosyltransferase family protein [Francisella frigiditurris]
MLKKIYFFVKNRPFPFFILLITIIYLSLLGYAPLFDRDEGYYVSVAMNMHTSRDFLLPVYNGTYWLEKPVLLYWLMNASIYLFGTTIFAMRFHAALSGIFLIISMYFLLIKILKDKKIALIISASVTFMPLTVLLARASMIDMTLTLFTTLTLLTFFIGTESKVPNDRKWYYFSWACMGITFFAKGPVGIAFILPSVGIYLLIQNKLWNVIKRVNFPVGILIFCLVNIWYFIVFYTMGYKFWNDFFVQQIFNRSSESLVGGTAIFAGLGGVFFYIGIIFSTTGPFIALAISGLLMSFKKEFIKRRTIFDKLALYSSIVCIIATIVFSLAATKLPYYIFPIYPFLGILVGYFWSNFSLDRELGKKIKRVFWTIFSLSTFILVLAGVLVPTVILFLDWNNIVVAGEQNINPVEYGIPYRIPTNLWLAYLVALISLLTFIGFRYLYKKNNFSYMLKTIILGGLALSISASFIFSSIVNWLQKPSINMSEAIKTRISKDAEIAELALIKPSLHYYIGREIINEYAFKTDISIHHKELGIEHYDLIENLNEFNKKFEQDDPYYLIVRKGIGDYKDINKVYRLEEFGPYLLLGNKYALEQWQSSTN